MPFLGVQPERAWLFQPEPVRAVAVNDAAAWRLHPAWRGVYDKLALALDAGLRAAPCGVAPMDVGVAADATVFVKPIINLAGMGLEARAVRADQVPAAPGCFWCEHLTGPHTSSDCLVQDGRVRWFAHTLAAADKDAERPRWWRVGVPAPHLEPWLGDWVARHLAGYTGICNLELIGGRPIEAHLRGSNGFFDLYGPGFIGAWVTLVDGAPDWQPPPPVPGGLIASLFGAPVPDAEAIAAAAAAGVTVRLDRHTPGRTAILHGADPSAVRTILQRLSGQG